MTRILSTRKDKIADTYIPAVIDELGELLKRRNTTAILEYLARHNIYSYYSEERLEVQKERNSDNEEFTGRFTFLDLNDEACLEIERVYPLMKNIHVNVYRADVIYALVLAGCSPIFLMKCFKDDPYRLSILKRILPTLDKHKIKSLENYNIQEQIASTYSAKEYTTMELIKFEYPCCPIVYDGMTYDLAKFVSCFANNMALGSDEANERLRHKEVFFAYPVFNLLRQILGTNSHRTQPSTAYRTLYAFGRYKYDNMIGIYGMIRELLDIMQQACFIPFLSLAISRFLYLSNCALNENELSKDPSELLIALFCSIILTRIFAREYTNPRQYSLLWFYHSESFDFRKSENIITEIAQRHGPAIRSNHNQYPEPLYFWHEVLMAREVSHIQQHNNATEVEELPACSKIKLH